MIFLFVLVVHVTDLKLNSVMVSFTCQFEWVMVRLDYTFFRVSVRCFWMRLAFRVPGLSKVHCLPQCGWEFSSPLWARIQQKAEEDELGLFFLPQYLSWDTSSHLLFSDWELFHWLLWFSSLCTQTKLYHWLPWGSSLQMADHEASQAS